MATGRGHCTRAGSHWVAIAAAKQALADAFCEEAVDDEIGEALGAVTESLPERKSIV